MASNSRRKWFSIKQASEFLGLDRTTVKRLVDTGQLRSIVLPGDAGKWRRIPKQDLETMQRGMERELDHPEGKWR